MQPNRKIKYCLNCGKPYYKNAKQSTPQFIMQKYCSHTCKRPWNKGLPAHNKGIKMSDEQKKKISEAQRGNKCKNFGIKTPLETRRKLSAARMGEKNHNWKGGISLNNKNRRYLLEYRLWRESVFKRDKYKCVLCGDDNGGNLEADHIKPFALFPELRYDITNGRTLCKKCHKKTFTYGKKLTRAHYE